MQLSFIVICLTMLTFQSKTSTESKSSRRGHRPILSSAKLRVEFCSALMWRREVWTFQMSIGFCSLTHLMIQMITFTESVGLQEELMDLEELFFLSLSMSLGSCAISNNRKSVLMSMNFQRASWPIFRSSS